MSKKNISNKSPKRKFHWLARQPDGTLEAFVEEPFGVPNYRGWAFADGGDTSAEIPSELYPELKPGDMINVAKLDPQFNNKFKKLLKEQ